MVAAHLIDPKILTSLDPREQFILEARLKSVILSNETVRKELASAISELDIKSKRTIK